MITVCIGHFIIFSVAFISYNLFVSYHNLNILISVFKRLFPPDVQFT